MLTEHAAQAWRQQRPWRSHCTACQSRCRFRTPRRAPALRLPRCVSHSVLQLTHLHHVALSKALSLHPMWLQGSASVGEHSHRSAASNGAAPEAGTYETVTLHVAGEAPCRRDQQVL